MKFGDLAGEAKKSNVKYYKFKEGKNKFRIVGDIIPRYVYWIKTPDGKNFSMECLAFDREQEKFTNIERDVVQERFPDLKCSWSYVCNVIDLNEGSDTEGEVVTMALKKKLFGQILETAKEHWGDPTDVKEGYDIVVIRKKTGPHSFNVEYSLDVLSSKQRALSPDELEKVEKAKPIAELFPRPTPEEQEAQLSRMFAVEEEESQEEVPDEVAEDVPF